MDTFKSYFTFENILRQLCKYRIQAARKRHKLHQIRDISLSSKSLNNFHKLHPIDPLLTQILPPRRQWVSIKKDHRALYKSSVKRNRLSLYRTVIKTRINSDYPKPKWYNELIAFVSKVQNAIDQDSNYNLSKPTIRPEIKEKKHLSVECRPLAEYEYFDRVIISLTAKYLTDLFDCYLVDSSCYAFRSSKTKPVKNHHEAIVDIRNYILKNRGHDIWVSECDIRKFYDCVNHKLASEALASFIKQAELDDKECHPSAIRIFNSYLESYNYLEDVYVKDGAYFERHNIKHGHFTFPLEDLREKYYNESLNTKIGVPQGGAISCLIANLLLHKADQVVLSSADDLRYLRFCDDMIILSKFRESCASALSRYLSVTDELKLLTHPPIKCDEYGSSFWKAKSKLEYKLSKFTVPWVSFVGYQIRYDGVIRARKEAIKKEVAKQRKETNRVLKALNAHDVELLNKNSRKSAKQQAVALEGRLISMSVGRITLHNWRVYTPEYCWAVGFKKLTDNHVVSKQLKNLDRERNKQLYRFKKKLAELTKETDNPDKTSDKTYKGSPFSYHCHARIRSKENDHS